MASGLGTYAGTYRTGYRYVQSQNLPAHYPHITSKSPSIIRGAKEKILNDFLSLANQQFFQSSGGVFQSFSSVEELDQLLQMWTSQNAGSELGQALSDGIAQKLNDDPWTGSGLTKGLTQGLNMENISDGRTKQAKKVLQEANSLWEKIEPLLQRYIEHYDSTKQDAYLAKCLEIYRRTGKTDSKFLNKYNNIQITSEQEKAMSSKVNGEFNKMDETLQKIMALINNKGNAGKAGIKQNPYTLGQSIGGNFSALGGETVGEIVGITAASLIKVKEKKVQKQIENMFESTGGKISFKGVQTGEDTVSIGELKVQAKGDWLISMTVNGVTIEIPVSQKMNALQRQGGKKAFWGKARKFQFVQELSLQALMSMTFMDSPEWIEQHLAVLSSSEKDSIDIQSNASELNNAVQLWNDFKENARYLGLFRALVGTGTRTSAGNLDFAALLVVNNRIVSVGDILMKAINGNSVFRMRPNNIIDFYQMRDIVSGPYYGEKNIHDIHKDDGGKGARISEQYAAIRKLYIEQKYKFEINMGLLGATR